MPKTTLRPATPEELYLMRSLLTSERPYRAMDIFISTLLTAWFVLFSLGSLFTCAGYLLGRLVDARTEFTIAGALLGLAVSSLIILDSCRKLRKNNKPFPAARQREVDAAQVEVTEYECLRYVVLRVVALQNVVLCFIEVAPRQVIAVPALDVKEPALSKFPSRLIGLARTPELKTYLGVCELSGEIMKPTREIVDRNLEYYIPGVAQILNISLDTLEADLIRFKQEHDAAKEN